MSIKVPKKTNSRKRATTVARGGAKRQKQIGVMKFKENKKVKRRKKKGNVEENDEDSEENERSFNDPHANGHV